MMLHSFFTAPLLKASSESGVSHSLRRGQRFCSRRRCCPADHELLEGLSKLSVEDCVDDRVQGGVHVAKPRRQDEEGHSWLAGWWKNRIGARNVADLKIEYSDKLHIWSVSKYH